VSHIISKVVNNRSVLLHSRTLPAVASNLIDEIGDDSDDKLYLQYFSSDYERFAMADEGPLFLMNPSGLLPGRYLLISCDFGRARGQVIFLHITH
jgi:hypothetical protein